MQAHPVASRRAAVLVFALLSGACAAPQTTSDQSVPDRLPRAERCLRVSDIQNWRVVDSRQLVVYGRRADDAWYVRLFTSCTDLNVSETVAFRARGTTLLCGDAGDEIITRAGRCPISSMRRIGPAEVAELLDKRVRKDIGKLPPRETPSTPKTSPEKP